MRLINVNTYKLESFTESSLPEYGILSHTWEGAEVDYAEMVNVTVHAINTNPRYYKIRGSCELAKEHTLRYMWNDTCCIDKSSSAELQEAINSMFRWYQKANVCFVYLNDHAAGQSMTVESLRRCRWSTRGWTLQELIAPSNVKFYAGDWSLIGSKEKNLHAIGYATSIDPKCLETGEVHAFSIAKRMSWAAKRECTRIEDVAYSLMGLFDINMPMLYGEGEKAFIRLQEEIIKTTYDPSIFAWVDKNANETMYRGLLARRPSDFESCSHLFFETQFENTAPYAITNLGLHLRSELHDVSDQKDAYIMPLTNVMFRGPVGDMQQGIYLKRLAEGSNQFARIDAHKVHRVDEFKSTSSSVFEDLYVRQAPVVPAAHVPRSIHAFRIRELDVSHTDRLGRHAIEAKIARCWPEAFWKKSSKMLVVESSTMLVHRIVWLEMDVREFSSDCAIVLSYDRSNGGKRVVIQYDIPRSMSDVQLVAKIDDLMHLNVPFDSQFKAALRFDHGISASSEAALSTNLANDAVVLDLSLNLRWAG